MLTHALAHTHTHTSVYIPNSIQKDLWKQQWLSEAPMLCAQGYASGSSDSPRDMIWVRPLTVHSRTVSQMGLRVLYLWSVFGFWKQKWGTEHLTSLFTLTFTCAQNCRTYSFKRDTKEVRLLLTTSKDFYSSLKFLFYKKINLKISFKEINFLFLKVILLFFFILFS